MTEPDDFYTQVLTASGFIAPRLAGHPSIAVILGTGQDLLPDGFVPQDTFLYPDIPGFPQTTVPGHPGRLVSGRLAEKRCLIFQGRFHWYEGHDAKTISLPVRVAAELGCQTLIITNTAGGLNLTFTPGDLMVINDHINLIPGNPLRGVNQEAWGPRFPDMSQAYSPRLKAIAGEAAAAREVLLRSGVYVGIQGPSLETPAETKLLRICGGDAVGMSTVLEVIAAAHSGLEVLGLSLIANINDPEAMQPIRIDEVISQVTKAAEKTCRLLGEIITRL